LAPGAVGLVESAATGASALLPEQMEKAAREKIASVATSAKAPFTAAAGYEDSIPRKLGEAIGSTAPFLLAGPLGLAGRAAAVGLGVGAGAGEARTRAEAEGATDEQRSKATAYGILPGAAEAFAPFRILSRIPDAATASAVQMIKRALLAGGEEAAQEAASGLAQNMIAKGIYKPEQALIEGLGEQAAYGGATGAIVQGLMDLALGRRAKGAAPAPTPRAEPGPQIAPEAPVGTQGTMFTEEEMGKRVPTPKETPEPKSAAVQQGEQLDLGLDFQRDYADLVKERETLRQQPQTPEVKARTTELSDQIMSLHENEVASLRAEKQTDAEAREKFPGLAAEPAQRGLFPELDVVRPEVAEPRLVTPPKNRQQEEARRRLEEADAQAAADVAQKQQERRGGQYRLPLRNVPEDRNVRRDLPIPVRPTEITQQDLEDIGVPMRTSQRWMEQNVIGKTPAEIQVLVGNNPDLLLGTGSRARILKYLTAPVPEGFKEEPRGTTPTQTNQPKPVAQPRRSEPSVGVSGQPASPQLVQPRPRVPAPARTPATPVGLGLAPAGQPVSPGATTQRAAQPTLNAPTTTPAITPPAAPAAPVARPTVAAKPAPQTAPAQAVETPAPAVATETVEEETARKAEAEDFKRRLEELERKQKETPKTQVSQPAKVTPTAKPTAREKAAADTRSAFDISGPSIYGEDIKAETEVARRGRTTGLKSVAIAKGQTLDALKEEVKNAKGVLGTALQRMVASGKVVLEDAHPSGKKIGGFYNGETVTLYANGIPSGQSMAVALHEVGAHLGMEKLLGKKQYNAVIDRILDMVAKGDGSTEAKMAQTAYKRIPVSDLERGVGRDEMVAYFVEEMAMSEAAGTLPKIGPMRVMWNQIKNAIVTSINKALGTNFGVKDFSAQDILDIAKSSFVAESETEVTKGETKQQFSVSASTESLIDSMGPLSAPDKSALTKMVNVIKSEPELDYVTKARTQVADIGATIEKRLSTKFDGAVRNSLGELNPMGLYRQAQDYTKMLLEYFQTGTLYKDPTTGLWMSGQGKGVRPPAEVYALIDQYAAKNGYSRDRATQIASRVLEGVRLDAMRRSNNTGMTNFAIHLKDNEIDQLVREYNADPDLKEMSKLMDEARIAMVNNMVKAGRLSKEEGTAWSEVAGYVPFDRIEDFSTNFNKIKKVSGKGLAQVGKLPELVGSIERPVGNVFDNYINTLGWMVGQTMKTDATVTTLRSLEDIEQAKKLRTGASPTANSVGAYVDGEMQYWELPSKYDVMAFKDLNPPKAGWLRNLGAFSNVLRKTVTILPPFALKQVTDDVQRAILTSGVKNPGALIWMSLTNFPKLALAELRGIQHPIVKEFGRLGLTGEYDFEAGKPASSLLKDLGYKERTLLGSTKLGALVHRLDGITRASDLAVRKAIYDQTLKESGNAVLAQTRAREFINFRRRGASDFVGAMVTTIPFFNAYIQGMDVLYRAASGKDSSASVDRAQARRLFWSRAGTVMMLSSLYALGKDDEDEDYKNMDLRTRDGNWILPGGYKIPVPGELGAIFKVLPERIVEYMRRQGTPEEQEAFEAVRTTLTYMFEQYLGRAVPIPQAIKPVMEAWANKSFLTGRDLEGFHQRAMDPSARVTDQTSELAKAISVFSRDQIGPEVSPIMIDNALRGYFGSSAALLTMMTDSLLNPTRVDRPLHKYALLSNYLYDPVGTRRMTEFYDEREKVGKANTTLNELMKTDLVRAEKYAEAHADELMMESAINSTLEQLERTRAYRKYLNSVEGAKDMSKEDREADLKEIKQMELEFVGWLREAKAELRKVQ
jgi:hypothetical protein